MNLTVDQFMSGLDRTLRELPGVLEEWPQLDQELQDEYAEQLGWMLSRFDAVQARSGSSAVALRLVAARLHLYSLRNQIRAVMEVEVALNSTLTIAGIQPATLPPSAPPSSPPSKRTSSAAGPGDGEVRSIAA